jgi:hypothetical protein
MRKNGEPKVLVQVRVSSTTAARLESWVRRYAHVFNRSDVLRIIYEMGLKECDRLKRIDITLQPGARTIVQRRSTVDEESG